MTINEAVEKIIRLGKGKAFKLKNPRMDPTEIRKALNERLKKRGASAKFEVKKISGTTDFNIIIRELRKGQIPKLSEEVKYESPKVALDELLYGAGWQIADEIAEYVERKGKPRTQKDFVSMLSKSIDKLPGEIREKLNLNEPTLRMIKKGIWENPNLAKPFADITDVRIIERKQKKDLALEKSILRAFEKFWVRGVGKPTYEMLTKESKLPEKILRECVPRLKEKGYPVAITRKGAIPEVHIPVRFRRLEELNLSPEILSKIHKKSLRSKDFAGRRAALRREIRVLERLTKKPPESIAGRLARQGIIHPLIDEEIERIHKVQEKRLRMLKKEIDAIERERIGLSKMKGRRRRKR